MPKEYEEEEDDQQPEQHHNNYQNYSEQEDVDLQRHIPVVYK